MLPQARFSMHVLSVAAEEQLSHVSCEFDCTRDLATVAAEMPLGCTSKH
jgi:hypothetical protein